MSDEFSDEALQRYPFAAVIAPSNWAKIALADISADVSPGFASGKHNLNGAGVPHLRPMNVDRDGKIDLSVVKSIAESNGVELKQGDVLFNNTNSAELIGKTAAVSSREAGFAYSNHMTCVRPERGVDSVFVARQLHFLWMSGYMKHRCTNHVNQASISSKTLANTIPILLPPSSEQIRIVEKLEELLSDLDAGVAELKAAQKKLGLYRQSLLKAAVEGRLTADWRNQQQTAPLPNPSPARGEGLQQTAPLPNPSPTRGEGLKPETSAAHIPQNSAALTPLSPRGRGVGGEGAISATVLGVERASITTTLESELPNTPSAQDQTWLQARARELRQQQTPQESTLWLQLRAKRFSGFKFRRRQTLGRFIVDFVCFSQKLIVELDGGQHTEAVDYDAERDAWLRQQGFRVLRFWNNEMAAQPMAVLDVIWQALVLAAPHPNPLAAPLPNPSPARGEGLNPETGALLLARILIERRARWEAKQLAKFAEQGKTPAKHWQAKYPEPVQADTRGLPDLPEGWVWASGEQLCEFITKGTTPPKDLNAVNDKSIPFLRVTNLTDNGELDLADKVFVSDETHRGFLARSAVYPNDVLMNIVGPPLGQVAVVPGSFKEWNINQAIAIFRAVDGVSPGYVCRYLLSPIAQQWLKARSKTTAGQTNLTLEVCRSLPFPLPPQDEQQALLLNLEAAIDATTRQSDAIEIALTQSAAQRKNILKAAFSGQLVSQDASDEPASRLLARIAKERAESDAVKKPRGRKAQEAA